MKIEYLSLENFVNVYAGLKRKKVELDFKKSKNKKILILGDNGSGKTVLLSSLQPYRETNDNREMAVLEDETRATKKINIRDGENLYEIVHYYGKSSSQNKSFIKKNGEELNTGGSIRSFLTILESELKITKDYFVLGRLGDNVSNFIDQGMADRKKYINKFIPNIDRFLDSYKITSDRLNSLDRQIKTITVSLERYGDLKENEAERTKLTERLASLEDLKTSVSSDLAIQTSKLTELQTKLADFPPELDRQIEDLTASIERDKATILASQVIKTESEAFSLSYTNGYLGRLHKKYSEELEALNGFKSKKTELEARIADSEGVIKKNLSTIEMMGDDSQESLEARKAELVELSDSLTKDLTELEADSDLTAFRQLNANINLTTFKTSLENLSYSVTNLVSGAPAIVSSHLLPDVKDFTNWNALREDMKVARVKRAELQETYQKMKAEYDKINRKSGLLEILDHSDHSDHAKDCPIVAMAIGFKDKAVTIADVAKQVEDTATELAQLDRAISTYDTNFTDLETFYESYTELLNKFYQADGQAFEVNGLTSSKAFMYQPEQLRKVIAQTLTKVNQALMWTDKARDLKEVTEKIAGIEKSLTSLSIINNLYAENSQRKQQIAEDETSISQLQVEIDGKNKKLTTIKFAIGRLEDNQSILTQLPEKEARLKEFTGLVEDYQRYTADLAEVNTQIQKLRPQEASLQTDLQNTRADLEQKNKDYYLITDSMERLNQIHAVRGYYKLVQDALDPKKGIPLIFSQNYLTSISEKANELLDVAYKGTYQIRFVLDKRDFRIEILKGDGNNLEDINLASQGETSMTSISLSLSMLGQIMKGQGGYNIIYLDEMDAELDANNRKSFINVIDRQMELLDVEQTFIITHNNEFHSSDIDLILLNGYETKIDITDPTIMEGKSIIYQNY